MKKVMQIMKTEAHGYNKYLTDKYLNNLTIEELRCFVHPLSKEYYDKILREIERQNTKQNETKKI
jgi:hypothetical protein